MRDWSDYIDSLGLPVGVYLNTPMKQLDVDDSLNRMGLIMTALVSREADPNDLFKTSFLTINFKLYEYQLSGLLLRHPDSKYGPSDVSRDQEKTFIQGVILTMIHNKDLNLVCQEFMKRYLDSKKNRTWRNWFQNKDIAGPAVFADLIRPFKDSPRWKIYLGDIDNLISSLIQIVVSHFNHDNVDRSVNMYNNMEYARLTIPTWISKMTAFLFRKLVYGGVKYQLDHYFRIQEASSPYSTSPPINELVQPILERYYS